MRKFLLLLAIAALPAAPAFCRATTPTVTPAPIPLDKALETLVTYRVTPEKAPEDVLAALTQLSTAIATLDSLPAPIKARLDSLLAEKQPTPSAKSPIKNNDPLSFLLVRYESRLIEATPLEKITPYRGAATFPGAVGEGAVPVAKSFTLDATVTGRTSLGLYAAPGAHITVSVEGKPDDIKAKGLKVQIGAHSDQLYNAINGRNQALRLPNVIRTFPIEGNTTLAANASGGLVYIAGPFGTTPGRLPVDRSEKPKPDFVKVKIEGAVASPYYEFGKTTAEEWRQQLATTKAPWAELTSRYLTLTVMTEDAKTVTDPAALMTEWERIGKASYALIGYRDGYQPLRPERFVCDVQISAGAAHAGYPIMMPIAWAKRYLSPEAMKTGNNWGLYHELGHNFQDPNWNFSENGEVTCNLFVFLVRKGLYGQVAWEEKPLTEGRAKLKQHLADGTNAWNIGDNFSRLLFWHELANELGFDIFQKAFTETRLNPAPENETQKRVLLLTRLSKAAGKNFGPYFVKWGILQPAEVPAELQQYPEWLPSAWPTT